MNTANPNTQARVLSSSVLAVAIAVLVGLAFLNPLWSSLSSPFPIARVAPPIAAPVDGPYYLENASEGYRWELEEYLSIWFHPLLPLLVSLMPSWLPASASFWLLGLASAAGSLVLTHQILALYAGHSRFSPGLVLLIVLVPGGMAIATGNPEIPTLFFSSLLLLSVVKWHSWLLTLASAVLAALTKPNALYMIPILCVYAIAGFKDRDRRLLAHSVAGAALIALTFLAWMFYVDWKIGSWGAYWQARTSFAQYVAGDPPRYFLELARILFYASDVRDLVRYSTALIIPLVNLWLIAFVPFAREVDRYALSVGNLTMLALVLWQGNPNKVIVYTTTLPGYFAANLLLAKGLFDKRFAFCGLHKTLIVLGYLLYLLAMLVVYVVGTPLGWYY